MIFAWLIVCMGATLALAFFYNRRVEDSPTARIWAWAWFTFFTGIVLASLADPISEVVSHGLGTLFPALLLAGALSFTDRRVPRWLLPGAAALGMLRGALSLSEANLALAAITVSIEPVLDFTGAYLLFRAAAKPRHSFPVTLLAASYVAIGCMEIWMASLALFDIDATHGQHVLLAIGASTSLILALAQRLALGDRVREREQDAMLVHARDLEILRRVAEAGTDHDDAVGFLAAACGAVRDAFAVDAGGVWLLSRDGTTLECAHHFGTGDDLPTGAASIPRGCPISDWVLTSHEPLFVDDLADQAGAPRDMISNVGVRSAVVAPLDWRGENLGILLLAVKPPQKLASSDRYLCVAVTRQLALGLQRVRAAEECARQTAALAEERRTLAAVLDTAPLGIPVTDERFREDELQRSQKLETVETQVGGIAHDFNNHLAVILGNASLLRPAVADDFRLGDVLRHLELSGRHCMELTRSLLAFGRRDSTAGSETVLVADDEPALRRLVRTSLSDHGYRVLEAADGDEAVQRFREAGSEIAIAVIDQTMPGRDGFATLAALRDLDPDLPAIIMSGYAIGEKATEAGAGFLGKPFDANELALLVRDELDGSRH